MMPKVVGASVLWGALLATFFACSPAPDTSRVTEIVAPDYRPGFNGEGGNVGVSTFLERRCGTLDCHGQIGRPLRIYGSRGLRLTLDDGGSNTTGKEATTEAERYANYQAAISVEPELMSVVENEGGANPDRLLLVRKPRQMERHKGGAVVVAGDDGDTCLISWLQGNTNFAACEGATNIGE